MTADAAIEKCSDNDTKSGHDDVDDDYVVGIMGACFHTASPGLCGHVFDITMYPVLFLRSTGTRKLVADTVSEV